MSESIHRLSAIVFTDIVGYTSLMGESEEKALDVLEKNKKIHQEYFTKYHCVYSKQMGDGFLAVFNSVINAVYACGFIQKECKENNINIRVGIHEGEIVFKDNDVFGDEVNISSRIEQAAENGTIFVSENVKRNVDNKSGIYVQFVKEFLLKNVKDPVRLYTLTVDTSQAPVISSKKTISSPNKKSNSKLIKIIISILVLVLASFLILKYDFILQYVDSISSQKPVLNLSEKSIAVLPLQNFSNNSENDYLGDGFSDHVIINLSKIPDFRVISRSSSFRFKNSEKSVNEIAKDLGVQNILEGSFQIISNDIHVNLNLIHGNSGEVLYADSYEGQLSELFELQEKIAESITSSLVGSFIKFKQTDKSIHKINLQAFKYYQLGQSILKENYLYRNTILDSRKMFKKAIIKDPEWSAPYIGLAESYFMDIQYGYKTFSNNQDSIEYCISKANVMNSELGELYSLKATVAYWSFEIKKAEELYKIAINLNPNYPFTYYYLAWIDLINQNSEGAVSNINKAISLDPLNEYLKMMRPTFLTFSGKHEQAKNLCIEMLEEEPGNNTTLFILGTVYSNMGEYENALKTLLKRSVGHETNFMVAYNYGKTGQKEKAMEILEHLLQLPEEKAPPTTQIGIVYLGLEDYDNAIHWFQKGLNTKDQWYVWLYQNWSDPINDDPRYIKILNTMNEYFNKPL